MNPKNEINDAIRQSSSRVWRIGTRQSQLAMLQAELVQSELQKLSTDTFVLVPMKTIGDKILDVPLSQTGEKGLFTKELEQALINNEVDLVVHSLKDVSTFIPPNLTLGAILKRANPHDALVLSKKHSQISDIASLPLNSVIGTSSVRRVAQLKHFYKHLKFECIRGNLNTRLNKLDCDNQYDGIVLATAALERLGWNNRISQILDSCNCLYAVGQGSLAIQCSKSSPLLPLLSILDHFESRVRCECERELMRKLQGGCSVPIGVETELDDCKVLSIRARVFSVDGEKFLEACGNSTISCVEDAIDLGNLVATKLLEQGAIELYSNRIK